MTADTYEAWRPGILSLLEQRRKQAASDFQNGIMVQRYIISSERVSLLGFRSKETFRCFCAGTTIVHLASTGARAMKT